MKIAIIGATGGTGSKVMARALELGHEVVAVARRPEAIVPAERLSIRKGDVFDASSLEKAIAGTEAVISCIGPPSNIPPNTPTKGLLNVVAGMKIMAANLSPGKVMSEGIPNIITACRRVGIKRLVMQSGINLTDGKELSAINRRVVGIMRRIFWKAIEDKSIAERAVMQMDMEWVIVRASVLKYAEGSLQYTAGPSACIAPLRQLSYADCADCLVRAATSEPEWVKKIVNVGR